MKRAGLLLRLVDKPLPPQGTVTRPYVRLDAALLCAGCEAIYAAETSQECPACGSRQAIALGRVMGERRAG